jgi:hypothetical protein
MSSIPQYQIVGLHKELRAQEKLDRASAHLLNTALSKLIHGTSNSQSIATQYPELQGMISRFINQNPSSPSRHIADLAYQRLNACATSTSSSFSSPQSQSNPATPQQSTSAQGSTSGSTAFNEENELLRKRIKELEEALASLGCSSEETPETIALRKECEEFYKEVREQKPLDIHIGSQLVRKLTAQNSTTLQLQFYKFLLGEGFPIVQSTDNMHLYNVLVNALNLIGQSQSWQKARSTVDSSMFKQETDKKAEEVQTIHQEKISHLSPYIGLTIEDDSFRIRLNENPNNIIFLLNKEKSNEFSHLLDSYLKISIPLTSREELSLIWYHLKKVFRYPDSNSQSAEELKKPINSMMSSLWNTLNNSKHEAKENEKNNETRREMLPRLGYYLVKDYGRLSRQIEDDQGFKIAHEQVININNNDPTLAEQSPALRLLKLTKDNIEKLEGKPSAFKAALNTLIPLLSRSTHQELKAVLFHIHTLDVFRTRDTLLPSLGEEILDRLKRREDISSRSSQPVIITENKAAIAAFDAILSSRR